MSIGTTTIANNGQVRFGLGALAEITDGYMRLAVYADIGYLSRLIDESLAISGW